jgi:hypothetical protein
MTDRNRAEAAERLRVVLGERSYDILIGPGLIESAGAAMLPPPEPRPAWHRKSGDRAAAR